MKKILLVALMAVAAMCYVGCKEEDVHEKVLDRLMGVWELHEGTIYQRYEFYDDNRNEVWQNHGIIVYRDSSSKVGGTFLYDSIGMSWGTADADPWHELHISPYEKILPNQFKPLCGYNLTLEWEDNNTFVVFGHKFHKVKTPTYW